MTGTEEGHHQFGTQQYINLDANRQFSSTVDNSGPQYAGPVDWSFFPDYDPGDPPPGDRDIFWSFEPQFDGQKLDILITAPEDFAYTLFRYGGSGYAVDQSGTVTAEPGETRQWTLNPSANDGSPIILRVANLAGTGQPVSLNATGSAPPDNTNHQWYKAWTLPSGVVDITFDNSTEHYQAAENPYFGITEEGTQSGYFFIENADDTRDVTLNLVGDTDGVVFTLYGIDDNTGEAYIAQRSVTQAGGAVATLTFTVPGSQGATLRTANSSGSGQNLRIYGTIVGDGQGPADETYMQWHHAYLLTPTADNTYGSVAAISLGTGRIVAEDNPTGTTLPGYQGAWVTFNVPASKSNVTFIVDIAEGAYLQLWQKVDDTWTLLNSSETAPGETTASFIANVVGGAQYYLRSASKQDVAGSNHVTIRGLPLQGTTVPRIEQAPVIKVAVGVPAPTDSRFRLYAKPFTVTVGMSSHVTGDIEREELPPVVVAVGMKPVTTPTLPLQMPPVRAGVRVVPVDVRRIRYGVLDPADESDLPITAPTLTGYVNLFEGDADDPGYIEAEFEYGVGAETSYMRLGLIKVPVEIYTSYSLAEVQLPELTPGTDYYWRMRIIVDDVPRAFTVWWSFGIAAPEVAAAVMPVTARITDGATYPHLWRIEPPVAAPGEVVTLIGYGFPTNQTGVTFGDTPLTIQDWRHIAATAAASTDTRMITEDLIDAPHDEIDVVVPDTREAGDSVVVQGGN